MAWVRTSVSLLGFGFTVYKFLEFEAAKDPVLGAEGPLLRLMRGPRNFALTFILLAIVSLAIAVVQHWQYTKNLDPVRGRKFDLTLVTAGFVAVIGVLSLMSLLFKIGPF